MINSQLPSAFGPLSTIRSLWSVVGYLVSIIWLAACSPADPALVARAVEGTLTAVPTQTPVVVVVTVMSQSEVSIPTATPAAPEATSTPVSEATPTATPEPSATLLPTTSAFSFPSETPLFSDDFTQTSAWPLGEDAARAVTVADGQLRFTIKVADTFRFVYNPDRRARDFVAAVTVGQTACAFRDRYGLLFRVQDNANYYQFEVDCDGRFRFSKTVGGVFTVLRDWSAATAINAGNNASNILIVQAQGSALELLVNGQTVLNLNETEFAEGGFGLYVGSNPTTGFTALFDDFRVWEAKP